MARGWKRSNEIFNFTTYENLILKSRVNMVNTVNTEKGISTTFSSESNRIVKSKISFKRHTKMI